MLSAAYAVARCLSVRPSASRSCILSKQINISSKFARSGSHSATPFQFLHTKRYGNILTGTPLTEPSNTGGVGQKNRDSRRISGYRIDVCWTAINCLRSTVQ